VAAERSYSLEKAITDLSRQGLLHSVLMPGNGRLIEETPDEAIKNVSQAINFSGAGLDSRNLKPGMLFVALAGEKVDGRVYAEGPLKNNHWVLTRKLPQDQDDPLINFKVSGGSGVFLCANPEKALACLAASWRDSLRVEIVAITGTNGKTTTKDFVAAMLSGAGKTQSTPGNFNNQLGLPLTLLNLDSDTRYAVIEMGASSIGEINFLAGLTKPKVGVITNASAAHLAEFGSLENIIDGKGELLDHLGKEAVAILNSDSPGYEQWLKRVSCDVVSWGTDKADHIWTWQPALGTAGEKVILDGKSWTIPLPGRHNGANLCAAVLACRSLGVDEEVLRKALGSFQGSAHRGVLLSWEGRTVLDDSYNANPVSMVAAVKTLVNLQATGRTFAVLGAMAEMGAESEEIHRRTGRDVLAENPDFLLAVGENAYPMVDNDGGNENLVKLETHIEAASWLMENTVPGDCILIKGSRSSAMELVLKQLQKSKPISQKEIEE